MKTVVVLDKLKELGFEHATLAGVSIGIDDMIIPEEKRPDHRPARKQIAEVEKQYRKGVITDGERYNKIVDIWTHATDRDLQRDVPGHGVTTARRRDNPVFMMVDSGARGSRSRSASSPACAA
jgi:DNA-directed RNA polymerase subunit beta'